MDEFDMIIPPDPNPNIASQMARELAYRRWRGQSAAESGTAVHAETSASSMPAASLLAHHRWKTSAQPSAPFAPAILDGGIPALPKNGDDNLGIFIFMTILACIVFSMRKGNSASNVNNIIPSPQAVLGPASNIVPQSAQAWPSWLMLGSIIAVLILLASSADARRYWGWIAGAEAILLAAIMPKK